MPKSEAPTTRGRPRFGTPRSEPVERMNISMTKAVFDRLEKYCVDEERPRSWVIQKALEVWLKEKGY